MGRYLNQGNESFEKSVNSEIYIDKVYQPCSEYAAGVCLYQKTG